MRMKAATLGVAMAFVLAACGGGSGSSVAPATDSGSGSESESRGGTTESITLTLSSNTFEQPSMDSIISDFEDAHPNISVEPSYAPLQERATLLATQFQAGNAPDIIGVSGGNAAPPSLVGYAESGNFVDLSSAPWVDQVPSFIESVVSVNGAVYALPALTYTVGVIYNKPFFEDLGLEVPETFDQLLGLCGEIRDKAPDLTPLAWPGPLTANAVMVQASSEVYAQNPEWDEQRQRGEVTFQSTPGWQDAVGSIVRLRDADCFGPSVAADSYQEVIAQMAGEQAAMGFAGDSLLVHIRGANEEIEFDMFPMPGRTQDETYIVLDPAQNYAINAESSSVDAAEAFVEFLAQPEQTSRLAAGSGLVSPQDWDRARDPAVAEEVLGGGHELYAPHTSRMVVNPTYFWPTTEVSSALTELSIGLLTGQTTVDDVLTAMDDAWPE